MSTRKIPGATYVATLPKGERALALLKLGGRLYVYSETMVHELILSEHRLVRVDLSDSAGENT